MQKFIMVSACFLGALGVVTGAFAAHALRTALETSGRLEAFETGVKYQFVHVLLMLAVGIMMDKWKHPFIGYAGLAAFAGILLFSGSIYALCLTDVRMGLVTPVGGLFLITSWVLLGAGLVKSL
ncbi:MAG: DUF423 domain-containing protein [Cytophagales bacterium]|nr:DUF423 domain-containing protein [Cytophagales bacterium]